MKVRHVLLLSLALYGFAYATDEDAMGDYGDDDEDYGGGGDEGYGEDDEGGGDGASAPEMSELTSVEEFESFIDFADDASVVAGFHATTIPDPSAKIPDGWDEEEDGEWQPPMIENPTYTTYSAAKQRAYKFRFGYTTNPDVLALLKQKSKAGVYPGLDHAWRSMSGEGRTW